ncbi:MAG: RsmB/NOP family class I SAM-dependent RNA methyltransferase [Promethearchaeota archaeon]|nr:MAG: RsmB/NOP family class I SAM-dependent RNA methyltransferase [Candidatus Lokiarchaeota archaeon]
MIERYIEFLGLHETIELLKANERLLIPSIRVNTLKIKVDELKKRLENKGFELEPIEWVSYGFNVVKETHNLGSLHEFLQGYYYLQNIASMLPPIILDPKPDELIVDMCAAPGSKATQLAQIMKNKGKLILIEKNKNRIPALEVNLRRMGVSNSIIMNYDAIQLEELNIKADKILLDAPCTGEGLIRSDISRKTSKGLKDINKMAIIQKKLLAAGLNGLKPGGQLLYSTCSIAPEENEVVINKILNSFSNFSITKIPKQYGNVGITNVYGRTLRNDLKHSQRFYPHIHDTIGFFLCLIEKSN